MSAIEETKPAYAAATGTIQGQAAAIMPVRSPPQLSVVVAAAVDASSDEYDGDDNGRGMECTDDPVAAAAVVARAAAKVGADNAQPGRKKRLCRFPGCNKVIKSQGHCQRHGAKAKRCKVEGCDKQAQGTHEGKGYICIIRFFICGQQKFVPMHAVKGFFSLAKKYALF